MEFHTRDLRKRRLSITGYHYLVTTSTKNREKHFSDFSIARILINTLKEADCRGYTKTIGFVVMPDHLHWLFKLGNINDLSNTIKRIKGTSAYRINKSKPKVNFYWQAGFHDHAVRDEGELAGLARYVVANPLRAGLVDRTGNYPHWDCMYL